MREEGESHSGKSMTEAPISKRGRWQFGLPALFVAVTILCITFAFPTYALVSGMLLLSVLGALITFTVVLYLPVAWVAWVAKRLTAKNYRARAKSTRQYPDAGIQR